MPYRTLTSPLWLPVYLNKRLLLLSSNHIRTAADLFNDPTIDHQAPQAVVGDRL